MLKNYFRTAWRNIKVGRGYSALNILGLAAGMAVALLIGLWVYNEYSYNRWLPNYQNLYQVRLNYTSQGKMNTQEPVSLPLAAALKKDIPGIQYVAESDWMDHHGLVVGDKKIYLNGGMVGDHFLQIFQFPLIKGDAVSSLHDPYSILLTESTAKALFGSDDPMNKMVRLDNAHDLKVTGVLKDIPKNSSFQFSYLIPFAYQDVTNDWVKGARTQWGNNSFQIFVSLNPNASFGQTSAKIKGIIADNVPEMRPGKPEVILHPFKDWRLYTEFTNGKAVGGFIDYVRMFIIIGVLVLMIACINFMNLSTARSEKRAREVGVRKAIGSRRKDLVLQFLMESVMMTLLSFLVTILLVEAVLPFFNTLTNSEIHIPFANPGFWGIMIGLVLLTGLLAGSRPALYLSSFQPVKVLKGTIHTGRTATLPRKVLVVLQFACSIALIVSTIVIYRQIQHAKDRPSGYDRDRLMVTDLSNDLNAKYTVIRDELLRSGIASKVARTSGAITELNSHTAIFDWPGKSPEQERLGVGAISVSKGYFSTIGVEIVSGKDFEGQYAKDSATLILNETAVKQLGLKQPLGQTLTWNGESKARIVGVVKDVVMENPFMPVTPTVFYSNNWGNFIYYRLAPGVRPQDAIAKLGPIFSKYNPAYPFIYRFVDTEYAQKFNFETLIGQLAGIFAALAIFISCLGLFGLAAYMAEQRSKEIGIRKVLGASVPQLWLLLSKEFLLLVIISCLIATPVAWYYLRHWLEGYDYRITLGPGVFVMAAALSILITLATVSFQAIRAALSNPIRNLRTE